jgi:2-desacetyl-2-hydroxyethyl bacteriochlorophyllide A dehydrogenase
MKAAVIRVVEGHKVLSAEEVELPVLGDNDILVKVAAAGICGSDVHGFFDPDGTARREGLIMSHEPSGEVTAVGPAVTRFSPGMRVTVDPQVSCGHCLPCSRGWISICDNKRVIGSSLRGFAQGAFAEYLAVDQKQVFAVPDGLSDSEAAMIEPLSNAIHVVNRAEIKLGDTVVVFGAGTLGLCMIQAAKLAGAGTLIVSDTSEFRLSIARELGADVTLNPTTTVVADEVIARTDGLGADVIIESVGIDATYQEAIRAVRKRGRIMFFGAVQDMVSLQLLPILHKELSLIGCTGANDETQIAIDLVAQGRIDVAKIVTHSFPLAAAEAAMDLLHTPGNEAVKVQVLP